MSKVDYIKPKNLISRNLGSLNNTTNTYNSSSYNASTYGGEDRVIDLGPVMVSSNSMKSFISFKREPVPFQVMRNLGVFQAGTTYNASTYNASVYGGADRLTDLGPHLANIILDSTPAPAPPPGANTGQPYGLLLTLLQP